MKIKLHICGFFTLLEKKIDCKIVIIQEGLFETNTVDVFFSLKPALTLSMLLMLLSLNLL